jgi:integrase
MPDDAFFSIMASARRKGYAFLLKDASVKRWYDNVARGSSVTADVYLRRLGSFCLHFKKAPEDLVSLSESKLYEMMLDYVSFMEKAGKTGSYIKSALKAVKSWLAHNGKEIRRKIKIKGSEDTPSLKDERVPTNEELKRIFLSGDKKSRVSCALVAHSGLRIETLGNYTGKDGLRIGDLPEIKVQRELVDFDRKPTLLIVRKELSKAGHQYLTFLSEEASEYLKDYLEERIREGEEVTPESPLVTPKMTMKPFIRAGNIGDLIRGAIRTAGFRWRPYVLRSYFDTQLMLAESKGLVMRDYRQFWMGHRGDIENRYTTNKCRLPENVIEDMREAYRRSQEFLLTTKAVETSEEKLTRAFRKQLLLVAGFKQEEVDKMDLHSISDEELQETVRKKLLGIEAGDCTKEKAVSTREVNKYLAQGWEYVANLPNKKVIIRLRT